MEVSLFLDPDLDQIELGKELGADAVELHTGTYALARDTRSKEAELVKLVNAGTRIRQLGMVLHAGHGLTYQNVRPIAELEGIQELNIGHSIVSRAIFVGFREATREMKNLSSIVGPVATSGMAAVGCPKRKADKKIGIKLN